MVVPFALAVGIAMVLGLFRLPWVAVLADAAICAALYMWSTRNTPDRPPKPDTAPAGPKRLSDRLIAYLGLVILMSLVAAVGYLLGRLFAFAPGRYVPHV